MKGAYWINVLILCAKKTIFNGKLKDILPALAQVKANVMFVYKYEEHKAILRHREHVFEKQWSLFINHLNQLYCNHLLFYSYLHVTILHNI